MPDKVERTLIFDLNKEKPTIDYLEIDITMHCNLNCKGCNHYAPLFKDNPVEIDFDKWKLGFDKLLTKFNIRRFGVLGGEPLLHSRWLDFIRYARKRLPKAEITFRTNGLLKQELLNNIEELNLLNIEVCISDYKINDIKTLDNFILGRCLKKYKFQHPAIDMNGNNDIEYSWSRCKHRHCLLMDDKYLYCCPYMNGIDILDKKFNLNLNIDLDNDGTRINYLEKSKSEIIDWLTNPHKCCRFCNLDYRLNKENEFKWTISKLEANEWIIDKE